MAYAYIEEPRVSRWFFGSPWAAWIWLIPRVWLGYEWLHAGWEKVHGPGSGAWINGGSAIKGFVSGADKAAHTPEHPQVAYDWWLSFLHFIGDHASAVGKIVAYGEVVIGIALILGFFTGIFAFLGLLLNFSYVFSGSAGVNPAFMAVGLLLVLAWRNAGWIGLDRFLLPTFGTPWAGRRRRVREPEGVEGRGRAEMSKTERERAASDTADTAG